MQASPSLQKFTTSKRFLLASFVAREYLLNHPCWQNETRALSLCSLSTKTSLSIRSLLENFSRQCPAAYGESDTIRDNIYISFLVGIVTIGGKHRIIADVRRHPKNNENQITCISLLLSATTRRVLDGPCVVDALAATPRACPTGNNLMKNEWHDVYYSSSCVVRELSLLSQNLSNQDPGAF